MGWFWENCRAEQPLDLPEQVPSSKLVPENQLSHLQTQGWSQSALTAYCNGIETEQWSDELAFEQSQCFGSPVFITLFEAALRGGESERSLLAVVMRVLDMPVELTQSPLILDQLLARFWPDLPPHDSFWKVLAETVDRAFPDLTLSSSQDLLAKQVHQLRYLLSTYQTVWVRRHYGGLGRDDRAALVAYLATADRRDSLWEWLGLSRYDYQLSYDLRESARLHNKRGHLKARPQAPLIFPDGRDDINLKVLVNWHSEFILTSRGKLINLLDPDGYDENGVINGASFNYGRRQGNRHHQLDILPVGRHDPRFRRKLLVGQELIYTSPNRNLWLWGRLWQESFFNPRGIYSRDGLSSYQRVRCLAKELHRAIKKERADLRNRRTFRPSIRK